jgi:phospholipid/cholesterol/gamma-HCH transport system permease protein
MTAEAAMYIPTAPSRRSRHEVLYQQYLTGLKTLGVVSVVGLFTGMIMALQTGMELRDYGQEYRVGWLVTEVMLREMGPMMAGIIIAASAGSAMAAQIGTMVVSEEVSALEVMSINPARYLVMPRLLALLIMMPLLTVYTNVVGVVGGAVVANTQLDVSYTTYFEWATRYTELRGLYIGLFKSVVFAVIIVTVSCHQGFSVTEGAVGVGNATRRTVIISLLSVLIAGYVITRLLYS